MKTKTIKVTIPEYLTLKQYQDIITFQGTDLQKLLFTVSSVSNYTEEQLRELPVDAIEEIAERITQLSFPKQTFHPLIEFDDKLYGFAYIAQCSVGEYIDLESLAKDVPNNLIKLAALLYRPVKKNRFGTIRYKVSQKVKSVANDVPNPFDYYTIEKYDSGKRKDREKLFENFPAHVVLGALSFFLSTATLYLNHILYSKGQITLRKKMIQEKEVMASLLASTGDGLVHSTHYQNPISFQSPAIRE